LWNINVTNQTISDELQSSVAIYLKCGDIVNNQIKKKFTAKSVGEKKIKLVDISQSYKQEHGRLMHFAFLAATLLKDEESARDNHVLAYNFAKYSPILIFFTDRLDKFFLFRY